MGFKNYLWDDAWELNVSRGKVRGAFHIIKFGSNDDVDSQLETVWDVGGIYPYLTSPSTLSISSDSPEDAAGGTGARTVVVQGLDENYVPVEEEITVGAGAGGVLFYRVFRAFVKTAGSSGTNEGTMTIDAGLTTLAGIRAVGSPTAYGLGQTFMSLYTVPSGYTGYIFQWDVSTAKSPGDIFLMKRLYGDGAWRAQDTIHTNINDVEREYKFPLKVEEKADIEVRAIAHTTGNMKVAATFCILLVQNDS